MYALDGHVAALNRLREKLQDAQRVMSEHNHYDNQNTARQIAEDPYPDGFERRSQVVQ